MFKKLFNKNRKRTIKKSYIEVQENDYVKFNLDLL